MSPEKAFPPGLADDVRAVAAIMPNESQPQRAWFTVHVGDDPVTIPARIYVDEPGWLGRRRLTDRQRAVLSCLYTRHHDGFVRQRHLQQVIGFAEPWVVPFVVRLVGEYVVEILDSVRAGLGEPPAVYGEFVVRNPDFFATTRRRVASYWDCYYRRPYPRLADYPGTLLVESLRAAAERAGERVF